MTKNLEFELFVTCPKGLQYALEKELIALGLTSTKAIPSGVHCLASQETCYKALLWSRIANRVILILSDDKVDSVEDVYESAISVPWEEHFALEKSFSVNFSGTNEFINNSAFGALKIKDAVVDGFRAKLGERPNVDRGDADVYISARLAKGRITLGLDLSGYSLHKRHYREDTGQAPLKENLAAGILMLSGWPDKFGTEGCLIDPMCGSGTFLVEAAQLATAYAPGMRREKWGFSSWLQHDSSLWNGLVEQAKTKHEQAKLEFKGRIVGFDQDARVVKKAWENIRRAGFEDCIHVEKRELSEFTLFESMKNGLLVVNPPYGERLGEVEKLGELYQDLGQTFLSFLLGWKAAVFTGNLDLGRELGWRSHKQYQLYNGAIESQLILVDLDESNRFKSAWVSPEKQLKNPALWKVSHESRANMFKNRILKNQKLIGKWAHKNNVSCFRLYDADMPEFSLAVDVYVDTGGQRWLHVQEYAAPSKVDPEAAIERLSEGLAVLRDTLDVKVDNIALKSRSVQKGKSQYEKKSDTSDFVLVREGDAQLWVNFKDYLDTGLFLDHRAIRRWMNASCEGKRVLNLFCYTSVVSVQAALGGAAYSLSLDMSKTYLAWAQRNYQVNDIDEKRHVLRRADCLDWLESDEGIADFDVVFLDPPSFSNSKSMEGILDVQRDHEQMIRRAMKRLRNGGVLIFSNNLRKFKLAENISEFYAVEDWKGKSLDKDFERNQSIHHCWKISKKEE